MTATKQFLTLCVSFLLLLQFGCSTAAQTETRIADEKQSSEALQRTSSSPEAVVSQYIALSKAGKYDELQKLVFVESHKIKPQDDKLADAPHPEILQKGTERLLLIRTPKMIFAGKLNVEAAKTISKTDSSVEIHVSLSSEIDASTTKMVFILKQSEDDDWKIIDIAPAF